MRYSPLVVGFAFGVAASMSAQAPHRASVARATRSFVDPETGVSLQLPVGWTSAAALTYGGDPLFSPATEDGFDPPRPRVRLGWQATEQGASPDDLVSTRQSFAYAVLRFPDAASCRKAFESRDSEGGGKDEVLRGVSFRHISYSDAGLGHSWSFEVYTTFHAGHCLAFSSGAETAHVDEGTPQKKDTGGSPEGIFKTLRFLPVPRKLK